MHGRRNTENKMFCNESNCGCNCMSCCGAICCSYKSYESPRKPQHTRFSVSEDSFEEPFEDMHWAIRPMVLKEQPKKDNLLEYRSEDLHFVCQFDWDDKTEVDVIIPDLADFYEI